MFTLFYIVVVTEKTRSFVVFYWFSGNLLFWGSLNTWCNLINADFNISYLGMVSFQTNYITCPSSIDGDDPNKSVNHPSKSENQMEKSENQTYHRESCDRFSRVTCVGVWTLNFQLGCRNWKFRLLQTGNFDNPTGNFEFELEISTLSNWIFRVWTANFEFELEISTSQLEISSCISG